MLDLHSLGGVRLEWVGRAVVALHCQTRRLALLCYLALRRPGEFVRCDALVTVFWPEVDQTRARNALRQAIHLLRQTLDPAVIVRHGDAELGIDPRYVRTDVQQFEELLRCHAYQEAMALYRGDFLEAFNITGAPAFERWVDDERRRLRALAACGCWTLADSAAQRGDAQAAESWGIQALLRSSDDERALRRLMYLLDAVGEPVRALRTFARFSKRLAIDLEVSPSPETIRLAREIRRALTRLQPSESRAY